MVGGDVLVGVRAPLLVRAADEVDAQLGQDVRRVVQRLRQILEAAPDQQVERPRIGGPGALDDPARALGRLPHAGVGRHLGLALLGDRPQRIGRRIAIRVPAQVRVVARVLVDHLEDVVLAARVRTATRPAPRGRRRRRRAAGAPSTADRRDRCRRCRSRSARDAGRRRARPGAPGGCAATSAEAAAKPATLRLKARSMRRFYAARRPRDG